MTRQRLGLVLGAALTCSVAVPARADAQICWWHPSLERCRALLITETAVSYPLLNTRADKRLPTFEGGTAAFAMDAFAPELLWELAVLLVVDERTALGPSLQLGVALGDAESTRRFGVRARRQLTRALAVEGTAGLIRGHAGNTGDRFFPARQKVGPSLEARANLKDWVSLRLRYDQLAWRDNTSEQRSTYPDGTAHALSGIVSLGARPSVPANVLLLAGAVLLAAGLP